MRGGEPKERLLAVRLPQHLLDALDERLAAMRERTPGVTVSRSDLARLAILAALRTRRPFDLGKDRSLPSAPVEPPKPPSRRLPRTRKNRSLDGDDP
jgi:hypothetical protein